MIAGHQADVGIGVQAAATQYRLGFVPVLKERYYLACRSDLLDAPALKKLLEVLASPDFAIAVAALPGYSTEDAGNILPAFDPSPA
jgi:molybdate-binding protein